MSRLNRRRFLAAGAAVACAPAFVSSREPSSKLRIAAIGVGGRGGANLNGVASEEIVALCDVNEASLAQAATRFPKARQFRDFRSMYDELKDSDFDAVVVSTTEHTHAFATLPALKRRKHVYCEKPLTHNVREARLITEAAKTARVATQLGTQIHAGSNYRRVVELIRGNAIGNVSEVHVWVSRAWGWQSPADAARHRDIVSTQERPVESKAPPKGLNWDLWIGPAPMRPFHDHYVPGPKWYRWWDFGNGTMSDLGAHWIDLPFWALNLNAPTLVTARGPAPHKELAPASMSATFHFGQRGAMGPVAMTWYQGELKPTAWTEARIPQWDSGCLFIGSEGMLLADYGKLLLLPQSKFEKFDRPARSIPESIGHYAEWIKACKEGTPTTCPFSYAGPLAESNHLGNVAFRSGERVEWDAKEMKIKNNPSAEQFLGREYRKGWKLA